MAKMEKEAKQKFQDKQIKALEDKFGSIITDLPNIYQLGRKVAICYILILSYRKLLLAIIIFSLINFPVLQTLCLLEMNFLYLVFIFKFKPFNTRKEYIL